MMCFQKAINFGVCWLLHSVIYPEIFSGSRLFAEAPSRFYWTAYVQRIPVR